MKLIGGYSMVDASGIDVSSLGEVAGIFDEITEAKNTGKPLYLYGVNNSGAVYSPMLAVAIEASESINIYTPVGNFNIDIDDTVTALEPEEDGEIEEPVTTVDQ